MNEPATEGLSLPASVFLIILIITFGLTAYNKSKPLQKLSLSQEDTIVSSLTANNYSAFDNQSNISGGDVISAINTKATADMTIIVITNSDTAGVKYSSATYNISDTSNTDYIDTGASFKSVLGKTYNGTVNKITFTQQAQ